MLIVPLLCLASGTSASPMQNVVHMLTGMVEKGNVEQHDEQVKSASHKQAYDETVARKEVIIAKAKKMISTPKTDAHLPQVPLPRHGPLKAARPQQPGPREPFPRPPAQEVQLRHRS